MVADPHGCHQSAGSLCCRAWLSHRVGSWKDPKDQSLALQQALPRGRDGPEHRAGQMPGAISRLFAPAGSALASCDVLLKPRFAPSSGSAPSKPWVSALLACSLAHSAPRPRAIRSREVSALSLFHLTLAVFQMPRYCGNSACCQLLQPCSNGNENQGSMPRILGACSRWIPLPHLAGARPGAGQQERICRAAASLLEWHTQATRRHLWPRWH